jgi:SAM-dependent methyltransferase
MEAAMEDDSLNRAIDRAYDFCKEQDLALEQGAITEEEWFVRHERQFASNYLASDSPRGQSGHGGDEQRYRYTQEMILEAIDRSGTFLDVGCANGYLMETLDRSLEPSGYKVEFHGLDFSPGLIELARRRLPQWKDRFHLGNALFWAPTDQFDLVCIRELNYVPKPRRKSFFHHLAGNYLRKGGRLILGPCTEIKTDPGVAALTAGWGYAPSGRSTKPHQEYAQLERRLLWYDF